MDQYKMKTKLFSNPLALNEALREIWARVPEQVDVDGVAVGSQAPSCFGRLGLVTAVYRRGCDFQGHAFVSYTVALSERDTVATGTGCSMSMKVGELIRSVALTGRLNSAECDALEHEMNAP